ncbi:Hypothetical protein R9X50_00588200 [Acrodontium crateriforme]|uniref:DUF7918 domain-containing protein n=1 Tax=Acrodontium crateriforme TaxID=150365 RepID=A0AAQ3MA65_9PEZI|nr:Hypothetical protein R9X50_00588200 [Acrodontium crateriforme]
MKVDSQPGLEVTLRVNGVLLHEYLDPDDERGSNNHATRFVEVPAGANFTLHYASDSAIRPKSNLDLIHARISLDGIAVYASALSVPISATISGVHVTEKGVSYLQKFGFGDLKTTDDAESEDVATLKNKYAGLGEISIKFTWARPAGPKQVKHHHNPLLEKHAHIPEECLKGRAMSNKTHLAPMEKSEPRTFCGIAYPYGKEPFATFTFKYRSRKDLQIEGIIPRSPSPQALEDMDPETLTMEQLREVARRAKAQRDAEVRIQKVNAEQSRQTQVAGKRKRTATIKSDPDDDVAVLSAASRRECQRQRTSFEGDTDVVDLTI